MNDLQPYQNPSSPAQFRVGDSSTAPQTIEIGSPSRKGDYAGLREYWQMVCRHKMAVAFAVVVGGVVGFLLTLSSPRVYQARISLEIQGFNEEFLNMKSVNPVSDNNGYYGSDIQTQVKILQSRALIERALKKVEAKPRPDGLQPVDRLGLWRKTLGISPPGDDDIWRQAIGTATGSVRVRGSDADRIVEVSCDSTHPRTAADFCNTLAEEYIEQNLEARWKTTERTGEWLTGQLQDLKIKLEKQEEELQTYARATALVISGNDKTDVNETRLADLQRELSLAQADRFAKQSKYEMAINSPSGALPDILDDPTLKETQQALAELRAKHAQLSVSLTPANAEVKRVQAQIDALEASLDAARSNVVTRIKGDFEGAQRRESLLSGAYQQQAHLVSGKAEEIAHFSLLKRDVDATRMLYDTLQQRLKEASITAALRANNVRVVDSALVPGAPYKPDIRRALGAGLLLGAMVGIAFALVRERMDRTLQDPGDVAYHLGLPELGVVPIGSLMDATRPKQIPSHLSGVQSATRGSADDRIEMMSFRQKTSLVAESFRTILTSILFSQHDGERPRVLVLTSASPKEGKTTVVSNLGIAVAEIQRRVLVIDADLRRPRLHQVFNVNNELGLSTLLSAKEPLSASRFLEACAGTSVPGLSVLPSGSSRANASSLLHSPRLAEVIALAREQFDTVVIDTPPMVNIADARVLARSGDALILVVRSGATTRDAGVLARTRFGEDGTPILGAILNYWDPQTPGYGYYYKSYYAGYYHYYGSGNGNHPPDDGSGNPPSVGGSGPTAPNVPNSAVWRPGFVFRPLLTDGEALEES